MNCNEDKHTYYCCIVRENACAHKTRATNLLAIFVQPLTDRFEFSNDVQRLVVLLVGISMRFPPGSHFKAVKRQRAQAVRHVTRFNQ